MVLKPEKKKMHKDQENILKHQLTSNNIGIFQKIKKESKLLDNSEMISKFRKLMQLN